MTTAPDPKIVRKIAETAFRSDTSGSAAERVETALIASGVAGPILGEKFDVYTKAVIAEYVRLAAARRSPAEQVQDDGDLRAIVEALDLISGLQSGEARPGDVSVDLKRNALYEHFAGRLAALDARDMVDADAARHAQRTS